MVDTPKNLPANEVAVQLANILSELQLSHVVALDIMKNCSWCDAIVVATYTSEVQARAAMHAAKELFYQHDMSIQNHSKAPQSKWIVVDAYSVVLHLLSEQERQFYALEELWRNGIELYNSASITP